MGGDSSQATTHTIHTYIRRWRRSLHETHLLWNAAFWRHAPSALFITTQPSHIILHGSAQVFPSLCIIYMYTIELVVWPQTKLPLRPRASADPESTLHSSYWPGCTRPTEKPSTNFTQLLSRKLVLNKLLVTHKNRRGTSCKQYIWHGSLAGNLFLVSTIILCFSSYTNLPLMQQEFDLWHTS